MKTPNINHKIKYVVVCNKNDKRLRWKCCMEAKIRETKQQNAFSTGIHTLLMRFFSVNFSISASSFKVQDLILHLTTSNFKGEDKGIWCTKPRCMHTVTAGFQNRFVKTKLTSRNKALICFMSLSVKSRKTCKSKEISNPNLSQK